MVFFANAKSDISPTESGIARLARSGILFASKNSQIEYHLVHAKYHCNAISLAKGEKRYPREIRVGTDFFVLFPQQADRLADFPNGIAVTGETCDHAAVFVGVGWNLAIVFFDECGTVL